MPDDPKKAPLSFDLALTKPMGMKRGKNPGSFVSATATQVHEFYGTVVQHIRVQRPVRPPRLPKEPKEPDPPIEDSITVPENAAVATWEDSPDTTPPSWP